MGWAFREANQFSIAAIADALVKVEHRELRPARAVLPATGSGLRVATAAVPDTAVAPEAAPGIAHQDPAACRIGGQCTPRVRRRLALPEPVRPLAVRAPEWVALAPVLAVRVLDRAAAWFPLRTRPRVHNERPARTADQVATSATKRPRKAR